MTQPISPLRRVLAALESGSASVEDIAKEAEVSVDEATLMLDHWVRVGAIVAAPLGRSCGGGCRSCDHGDEAGATGCASPGSLDAARNGGPVLVALTLRRP